jgi:hypothetical protein
LVHNEEEVDDMAEIKKYDFKFSVGEVLQRTHLAYGAAHLRKGGPSSKAT